MRHEIIVVAFPWLFPLIVMAASGDWYWFDGWLWCIPYMATTYLICIYLYCQDPGLLAERCRTSSDDQEPVDKVLMKLLSLFLISWFLVIPIDVKRYEWSTSMRWMPFHPVLKWSAFLLTFPALFTLFRSFYDCTFASPILRIQKERKHKVIDRGSFGVVRHPMYSGVIQWMFSSSIFFSSFYAMIVACCFAAVLLIRIEYEEEMLCKALDGYKEYQKRVKYKLLPYFI